MTNFLELALSYAARGLYVLPLKPRDKFPIIPKSKGGSGYKDATLDADLIRSWWTRWPNANVGIACGASNKTVVDCDHGLGSHEDFITWRDRNGIPVTYTVRSGRRVSKEDGVTPVFCVQMYFDGAISYNGKFELDGVSGEIRSAGALVVAVGSIHPDSGETYEVLIDAPVAQRPPQVEQACTRAKNAEVQRKPGEKISEGRNNALVSEIGKFRHRNPGVSQSMTLAAMLAWNDENCEPPLSEAEVSETVVKQFRQYEDTVETPNLTVSGKPEEKPVTDWRELFHTREEAENAPPISFLIDGFLQREGVTGLAAPVRERKSLIALNVAHALVTGEKLFDHFDVTKKPERVLYLCPEMALGPFSDRLKKIGLLNYVGDRLFYRTLSKDGRLNLSDAALKAALPGSVVILDTAVRFIQGDEDSSTDMRLFADELFALLRAGAEAVLVLYHSPKSQGNADMMTLENALRGSGDLGAALACCWGTRLQDISKPYESASYLENLKQRDFESKPFEVTSGPDCRLHIVGDPSVTVAKLQPRSGNKANKDGKDAAAEAVIKANPKMPVRELEKLLESMEMKRGRTWISKARVRLGLSGVTCGEAA